MHPARLAWLAQTFEVCGQVLERSGAKKGHLRVWDLICASEPSLRECYRITHTRGLKVPEMARSWKGASSHELAVTFNCQAGVRGLLVHCPGDNGDGPLDCLPTTRFKWSRADFSSFSQRPGCRVHGLVVDNRTALGASDGVGRPDAGTRVCDCSFELTRVRV